MSAGLYIHVPFCLSKCVYCDFYSLPGHDLIDKFTFSLEQEIKNYSEIWKDNDFDTLYFGGGTPSLLSPHSIAEIISAARKYFQLTDNAEITLECNPDDVNKKFAKLIKNAGVNRVSIGVQSLSDKRLNFLGRRHQAQTALDAIQTFIDAGIDNISVDMIYGLPGLTLSEWESELKMLLGYPVKHLSAYMLSVHENTPLNEKLLTGEIVLPGEEDLYKQYLSLISIANDKGFKQYEISNFAKEGCLSKHNIKYWKALPYLGLGPAAHSFDGSSRFWNPDRLDLYTSNFIEYLALRSTERLTEKEKFNEYVMNSLRTIDGLDIPYLKSNFKTFSDRFIISINDLKKSWITQNEKRLQLTTEGLFVSDYIIEKLMII